MRRFPTLKDVAKEAGTTAATVSYVLSGNAKRYVSPDMRERVLAAVRTTGYIKSSPASSLQGKRQGIIAVLVPQFSNPYFTELMLSIESVLDEEGILLSISNTFDNPERERDIIVKMAQQRVDGYILIPTTEGARNTELMRRMGVPMVFVDRPLLGVDDDFTEVVPDNYRSGYLLGEHLAQRGHSQVAYVGWDSGFETLDQRRDGLWDGLAAVAGNRLPELAIDEDFSIEGGYRAAEALHRQHPEMTAWCLGYNVPARGSIDYLRDQGIEPGKDLSVVMVGNPDWATAGRNDFTLVDLDPGSLGRTAAERLLDHLVDPTATPSTTTIDCRLRVGSSVTDFRNR